MCSTTCVTMGPQGTTRATRSILQARLALSAPRILSVQTACCVVIIHFVLEFECEVCADVVFVCYNNDELLVSGIEGICHYWDSKE